MLDFNHFMRLKIKWMFALGNLPMFLAICSVNSVFLFILMYPSPVLSLLALHVLLPLIVHSIMFNSLVRHILVPQFSWVNIWCYIYANVLSQVIFNLICSCAWICSVYFKVFVFYASYKSLYVPAKCHIIFSLKRKYL